MSNVVYEDQMYIGYFPENNKHSDNIFNGQKNNCIVKIILENGYATGFLLKIPYGNKNQFLLVLMTNNHVINEAFPKNNRYLAVCKADQIMYII